MRGIDMDYRQDKYIGDIFESICGLVRIIRDKGQPEYQSNIRTDVDLLTVHSDYIALQTTALSVVKVDDQASIDLIDRCANRVSNALARLAEGESCGG
jgi:hypothetical protein